ncbi:MAG: DNA-3-methyladenine glycosylase [Rhizobiaceae bacterium]
MATNQNQLFIQHIRNNADLSKGLAGLRKLDPSLGIIIDSLREVPLRLRPPGFEGLAEIITAQQVSKASATVIFGRLLNLITPLTAEQFLHAGEAPLIEAGLSRAKQTTLTGLAQAVVNGEFDLEQLTLLPIHEAMDKLTSLKGIGPWTAEVFLLFCAGHADIFPAGDVALQHAAGDVCGLTEKPDGKTTRQLAERWAPLRGVAARVLYAHYSAHRKIDTIPV